MSWINSLHSDIWQRLERKGASGLIQYLVFAQCQVCPPTAGQWYFKSLLAAYKGNNLSFLTRSKVGQDVYLTTCMICSNLQQESLFMPTASLQSTPTSCHLYYSTSVGMESSSLAPRDQNSRDYLKKRSYLSLSGRAVTFNQVLTSAAVQSCPPLTSLSVSYPTLRSA